MTLTKTLTLALIIVSLFSCTKEESTSNEIRKSEVSSKKIVAVNPDDLNFEENEEFRDESELNFIISVAEGYNYDSLKSLALQTAALLNFKFDTLGRYYHPEKGIVVPENADDEMWAGEYFLRRMSDDIVSVEMRHAYIDTAIANNELQVERFSQDTSRMFVFAMMYPSKESADSLAEIIRVDFPETKVFPATIYMGCMH